MQRGGAVFVHSESYMNLTRCTFSENSARIGAAIVAENCENRIVENVSKDAVTVIDSKFISNNAT